ncbi:siderophore ABC transporter substrate-binding protein [Halalkalibacterium ligniniphilum]|uniref:siderophore ABC transporter substrate-binding protein n=1 Tax=Halalkalibacterium ligniniphilum TaxID=1134413 RepID=UPI0003498521|nr:siderophore ABC transporter substrate-binding protein [Halalkalibacterium ligniniphilum]
MKRSLTLFFVLLFLAVFAAACGPNEASGTPDEPVITEETDEKAADTEETELTIQHELGETIVPKNPSKVAVFDLGVLDTLDTLGVEEVVAVPKDNVPDYLEKYKGDAYENAGTLFEPDFEKLYDLQPDLIIISGRASEAYDDLSEIAPTIFIGLDTTNFLESFEGNVTTLAEIFGKEEAAEQELAAIKESIKALNEKASAAEANGLVVLANDGEMSAYGPGSRFGFLHDDFGVAPIDENIEASNHGQTISYEYIVDKDPEYLFVIDRGAIVGGETSAQEALENDLIKTTTAYEEGNIVYLNAVYWYITTGGLTSMAGMLEEVSAGLE